MEKHYSIDPGQGSKMDGCPYSVFEDGHDVQEYIIPPKGYVFTGFKFESLRNNQIYEGKLVAQYEKSSIKERLTMNIWKILIPVFIVAVIAFVSILAIGIFKDPKPAKPKPKKPKTETVGTPVDTITTQDVDTNPTIDGSVQVKEDTKDTDVLPDLTNKPKQQNENQGIEEEHRTPQPTAEDPNVKFKHEFWTLIHNSVIMMDPYHELYVNYKGKVECEEFEYLRLTILKDYVSFKEWYEKLRKIPENQLRSIESIEELKNKLK